MAQRKGISYRLLSTVDTVLPRSFYDHPKKRKTALGPMLLLAAIVYAAAGVTFVVLAVQASQNTTVETIIQNHDISGSNSYTCQMISRVSSTTVATIASEPSNSSSLVNVMESKSQCEADLKTAQPCSSPPTYIAGNSQKSNYAGSPFVNVVLFGEYAVFLDDAAGLFSYNYNTGTKKIVGYSDYYSTTSSMAVDAQGTLYIISDCAANQGSCVIALNTTFEVEGASTSSRQFVQFPTHLNGIINDNVYNLYVFDNQTVYSLSSTGSIVPIFSVANFTSADIAFGPQADSAEPHAVNATSIYSVAVYYDQITKSKVIFFASDGDGVYSELYQYSSNAGTNTLTLIYESSNIVAPIVAGSADILYFTTYKTFIMFNISLDYSVFTNIDFPTGDRYLGLAVSINGDRLLTTTSSGLADFPTTTGVYMVYPSMGASRGLQTVLQQSSFAGAWFTCGDKVVSPVPQSTAVYGAKCANNGFVEQVLYQNSYTFTAADAATFVTNNAPAYCTFDWACPALADLPPYSCSRTIRPSFFEYIGTAYANTALLMTIMLFLFALLLTRLAKHYPPEGTNMHPPEVEMAGMDNPMRSEP